MQEFQHSIDQIPIDFILQANKQCFLINFLMKYTPLTTEDLAKTLGITAKKLLSVRNQKKYLTLSESKKLVEYFCMCCGS